MSQIKQSTEKLAFVSSNELFGMCNLFIHVGFIKDDPSLRLMKIFSKTMTASVC